MKKSHPSGMRGWTELCSDVNWEDYHGMWCKKAKDGSFYVVQWTNMIDACGKEGEDMPFEVQVKRIDLKEIPAKNVEAALKSCGASDLIKPLFSLGRMDITDLITIEACIQHGLGAPLLGKCSKNYPKRLRADARRYAEYIMKDQNQWFLRDRLNRKVNALGSTAQEYGVGDIDSALHRIDENSPAANQLVKRITFGKV